MFCNGSTVDDLTEVIREACRGVNNMQAIKGTTARVISFSEEKRIHLSCTEDDFFELFPDAKRERFTKEFDEVSTVYAGCQFFALVTPDPMNDRTQDAKKATVERAAKIANSMDVF